MKFQTLNDLIRAVGGRRFLLTVGASAINCLLLVGGYIGEQTWLVAFLATVGAFVGANTYQKVQEAKSA